MKRPKAELIDQALSAGFWFWLGFAATLYLLVKIL